MRNPCMLDVHAGIFATILQKCQLELVWPASAAVLQEKRMQYRLQCRHSCAGSFRKCRRLGRAHLALPFHAVQAGTACPWLQQMQQQLAEAAWLRVLVAPGAAQGCSPFQTCAC